MRTWHSYWFSAGLRFALPFILSLVVNYSSEHKRNSDRKQCEVVISEIYGDVPGASDNAFIELQAVCEKGDPMDFSLAGYKLIIEENGDVIATVALQNFRMDAKGFLTIGGAKVTTKSISFTSNWVKMQGILKHSLGTKSVASVFKRKRKLYSIILLKRKPEEANKPSRIGEIEIPAKQINKKITPDMEVIISEYAVDGVVLGIDVGACDKYSRMLPRLGEKAEDYILPLPDKLISPPTSNEDGESHNRGGRRRRSQTSKKKPPKTPAPGQRTLAGFLTGSGANRNRTLTSGGVPSIINQGGLPSQQGRNNEQESILLSSASLTPGRNPQTSDGGGGSVAGSSTGGESSSSAGVSSSSANIPPLPETSAYEFRSLSRCTVLTHGFLPSSFRITTPTPNIENACEDGTPVHLIPNDEDVIQQPQPADDNDEMPTTCETRKNSVAQTIISHSINQPYEFFDTLSGDDLSTLSEVFILNERKLEILRQSLQRNTPENVVTDNDLPKINQVIQHFSTNRNPNVPVQWIKDKKQILQSWLEVIDVDKKENAKLRCRLCHSYSSRGDPQLSTAYKPELADGWVGSSVDATRDKLRTHATTGWHSTIVDIEENAKKAAIETGRENALLRQFQQLNNKEKSTAYMMLLVYAETRLFIPFNGHKGVVSLVELLGTNLGGPAGLHRNHHSAQLFVVTISNDLHTTLLQHLYKRRTKFSLIIDSAIDSVGRDYLVLLIQTLVRDRPAVYFYKLLAVGVDSRATAYLKLITDAFKSDVLVAANPSRNIAEYTMFDLATENLVGFVSDGAAVMTGRNGGLATLLSRTFRGTDHGAGSLFRTHCVAHRLNLATRKVVNLCTAIQVFEGQIKTTSNFFGNYNAKNLAHLAATAEAYQVNSKRITYTFDTRWSNSNKLILERVRDMIPIVKLSTESISQDVGNFNADTRAKATGVKLIVTSREFVLMTYHMSDVISIVGAYSEIFQRTGHLVVELIQHKKAMIGKLNALKESNGRYMGQLLAHLQCRKTELTTSYVPCRKVQAVITSFSVRMKEQQLPNGKVLPSIDLEDVKQRTGRAGPPYQPILDKIVDDLVSEIESYFPETDLESFEILIPAKFEKENMISGTYGTQEIATIANRFGIPADAAVREWQFFCQQLAAYPNYDLLVSGTSTEKFWPTILRSPESMSHVQPNLRKLLRIVLVIPSSSSDAERAFSSMNLIVSGRRTRMKLVTLDALLRVTLNGPTDYKQFPFWKYGKGWKGRHAAFHNTFKPGRKRKTPTDTVDDLTNARMLFGTDNTELTEQDEQQMLAEAAAFMELDDDDDEMVEVGPVDYVAIDDDTYIMEDVPDLFGLDPDN